ncbi:MAG: TraB/VirB10 family protein [Desulfobacteraceae bacterium]|jgi:conjugal transfer pilus assembly protein TraB
MNNLRSLLSKLSPNTRKYIYWAFLAMGILTFSTLIYNAKTQSAQDKPTGTVVTKKIDMLDYDEGVFEESLFQRVKKDIDALNGEVENIKESFSNDIKEIKDILNDLKENQPMPPPAPKVPEKITLPPKNEPETPRSQINQDLSEDETLLAQAQAYERLKQFSDGMQSNLDEVDPKWQNYAYAGPPTAVADSQASEEESTPEKTSGIEIFAVEPRKEDQKQGSDIINLTSGSFMEASLLTGVVTSTGNNQPVPMLIRINELAQLPNEIKEDLKGCFVVAEGTAALDQERILSRVLNLSCVTKDGVAIIDEKIKGWVADQDSRPGLDAKPIAKFGAHLARSALAGFIGGLGSAINESTLIREQNIVGGRDTTFEDTELDTMFRAGLGRGIEKVTDSLEKFYMDLAKSTLPVLEVGPTKNITVVLSEGVNLEIKARNQKPEDKRGA